MPLTREQILAAQDLPTKEVHVPEWNGSVFLKTLTALEKDRWEQGNADAKQDDEKVNIIGIRRRLMALVICDEKGTRLFADSDAELIGEKSAPAIDRLFPTALEMNGLTKKEVEKLAKN